MGKGSRNRAIRKRAAGLAVESDFSAPRIARALRKGRMPAGPVERTRSERTTAIPTRIFAIVRRRKSIDRRLRKANRRKK